MEDFDEYVQQMTGGSQIYGMLINKLNPDHLFFIDSSPSQLIRRGKKAKPLKIPGPKRLSLSMAPKLQATRFLRNFHSTQRKSLDLG